MKNCLRFIFCFAICIFWSVGNVYANNDLFKNWYYDRKMSACLILPLHEFNTSRSQYYFDSAVLNGYENPTWRPLTQFYEWTSGLTFIQNEKYIKIYDLYSRLPIATEPKNNIFNFEDMDLRENHILHPLVAEQMIIRAINYHRFNYMLHSYQRLSTISIAAIYHSIEQRNLGIQSQNDSVGRTHQQRMQLWSRPVRKYVRSSHVSTHQILGEFSQVYANEIVDRLMRTNTASWLMNGYYHYLGVGLGIQEDGTVRLTIHMATAYSHGAIAYHQYNIHGAGRGRQETYDLHTALANAWFLENRYGETNLYR